MNDIDLFRYLFDSSQALTIETISFNMAVTTVIALLIFFVYKVTFNGVLYSLSFNITIVMVSMATAMIIMLIGSNLAISLGMVGALSIVRFRSAIKDPRDLGFLFWAISTGLAAGTGAFFIAVIGSLFIAFLMLAFGKAVYKDNCYLLVLKGEEINTECVIGILKEYGIKHKLRMKNVNSSFSEVTYEVFLKDQKAAKIVEHLKSAANLHEVNLVSFNGEITG